MQCIPCPLVCVCWQPVEVQPLIPWAVPAPLGKVEVVNKQPVHQELLDNLLVGLLVLAGTLAHQRVVMREQAVPVAVRQPVRGVQVPVGLVVLEAVQLLVQEELVPAVQVEAEQAEQEVLADNHPCCAAQLSIPFARTTCSVILNPTSVEKIHKVKGLEPVNPSLKRAIPAVQPKAYVDVTGKPIAIPVRRMRKAWTTQAIPALRLRDAKTIWIVHPGIFAISR
jgi:hypothetical protein